MKKFAILILGLALTAASCDILDPFGPGGVKGVFISDDAGESFRPSNQVGAKSSLDNVSINSLVFEPRNYDILYAGTANGMYKSEDGGQTWTYILTGIVVADIAVDPNIIDYIYAAGLSGGNGKIIKSTDGGKSWTDIYSEPTKGNAVLTIAVSRINSNVILAGLNNGELIRSTDAGHTWQAARDFQDRIIKVRFGSNNTAYALSHHNGLSKSLDQGTTWTSLTSSLISDVITNRDSVISNVSLFHDLALDQKQSGVLYLGTEEGLIRSVDDGNTWAFMKLPVRNVSIQVTSAAVNPNNSNNIITVVADTIFKSVNGGVTWETKKLGTGQTTRIILINPETPNVVYLGLGDKR